MDSSASVSHYEFSRVREFLGQLVAQLPLGPGAVSASLVHVSSRPHTEFPFSQHSSGAAVQDAIRAAAQLMGDTNTGLALAYAKEQLFAEAAGARPGVPKVLVWVTDGGSSDPVGPPMQELKDLGVTVFIVSTGRGNLLELSAAASAPAEQHLHFVDVDDLHIITQQLGASIVGRWDDGVWGTPAKVRAESWSEPGSKGPGERLRCSPGLPQGGDHCVLRQLGCGGTQGQACVNSCGVSLCRAGGPREQGQRLHRGDVAPWRKRKEVPSPRTLRMGSMCACPRASARRAWGGGQVRRGQPAPHRAGGGRLHGFEGVCTAGGCGNCWRGGWTREGLLQPP